MSVVMTKISKQDKLDTINFFFAKQGKRLSSKSLTGKIMDVIIAEHNIDSYVFDQMMAQRTIEKEEKEKERIEDYKRFQEKRRIEKEKDDKEKQDFENLPKILKKLCEKKYEVEEYMRHLKNSRYELSSARRLIADALKYGGKPERCFMNEDGTATINGATVHMITGSFDEHFGEKIYQKKYIRELIRNTIVVRVKKIRA
jgi:hypothetical protein